MSKIKVDSQGYANYGEGVSESEARLLETEKLIEAKVTAMYKKLLDEHKANVTLLVNQALTNANASYNISQDAKNIAEGNSQKVDGFGEAVSSKVDKANVYNGLDSTDPKQVLSAPQGKLLDEKIEREIQMLDDKLGVKHQNDMYSLIKEITDIEDKISYKALSPNADLDNLDDGWYHLPSGHNSFEEALGHNYPHTLYQTSAATGYTVQIAMCPQSIMWRGKDDGYWMVWKKLSLNVIDNLTSTDKTSALSANQGKMLNDKIGDIETLLGGI